MKKIGWCLLMVSCLFCLVACAPVEEVEPAGPDVDDESPALTETSMALLTQMMALDYETMYVEDFQEQVQALCAQQGLTLEQVLAAAAGEICDAQGEVIGFAQADASTTQFITTTLRYTQCALSGEGWCQDFVYYEGADAYREALLLKQQELGPLAWQEYYREELAPVLDLQVRLSYEMMLAPVAPGLLTVAERDARCQDLQQQVERYFLHLTPQQLLAADAQQTLDAACASLATQASNDVLTFSCHLQALTIEINRLAE